jgi:hypothetical protein
LGGRYWISGVSIGMLRAFAKQENEADINKLLDNIEENQYLGDKEDFEKTFKKKIKNK